MTNSSTHRTKTLPNEIVFREIEQQLADGQTVGLHVKGGSMRPFVHNGDWVELANTRTRRLRRWDIVLARTDFGTVMHRIVRLHRDGRLTLAGDANQRQVERCTLADVIGVAINARRGDKSLSINTAWKRLLAKLWWSLFPVRAFILKLSH